MNQGFTLIELLVVVLIIGILSAVALPQYQTAVERSRATEALTQMNAIQTAAERYHAQHEAWPTDNNFNQLDVDIPQRSAGVYGGKNFTFAFTKNTSTGKLEIVATRALLDSTKSHPHPYTLKTTVTDNDNGTYSAVRSCAAVTSTDSDAVDYCNAISGGNKNDF